MIGDQPAPGSHPDSDAVVDGAVEVSFVEPSRAEHTDASSTSSSFRGGQGGAVLHMRRHTEQQSGGHRDVSRGSLRYTSWNELSLASANRAEF